MGVIEKEETVEYCEDCKHCINIKRNGLYCTQFLRSKYDRRYYRICEHVRVNKPQCVKFSLKKKGVLRRIMLFLRLTTKG